MGDERAETYLRLLAESEARRAARRSGLVPAADIYPTVEQVRWAGDILVVAGVLEEDDVHRVATELEAALLARSDMDRARYARRVNWVFDERTDTSGGGPPPRWWGDMQPMRSTPIGRRISVAYERAPSDLHLMTLVCSPDGAAITAAMRMHWPPDGSSADLEINGAGPEHLPYDQLWAADDRGARYRVVLIGESGTLAWQGAIVLHGVPPPDARWLDLIADGTHRLVRIDLDREVVQPAAATEPAPAVSAGEHMLAAAAERILASAWDLGGVGWAGCAGGPRADERLGETITVLAAAGAIGADSPVPGHLAALCQRLGVAGVTVPAAAQIPARWAEVLPPDPSGPAGPADPVGPDGPADPEWFVPLGRVAVDVEDARFVFAGLATAGGQSFLHVVATGMQPLAVHHWDTGFSWWVTDSAGQSHLATETDPHAREHRQSAFRLRLTPPLRARPEEIEVMVTGRRGRARAVVPVGREMPDT